jgi:hypothetical protein
MPDVPCACGYDNTRANLRLLRYAVTRQPARRKEYFPGLLAFRCGGRHNGESHRLPPVGPPDLDGSGSLNVFANGRAVDMGARDGYLIDCIALQDTLAPWE